MGGEDDSVVVWVWAVCGIYCFLTTTELIRSRHDVLSARREVFMIVMKVFMFCFFYYLYTSIDGI